MTPMTKARLDAGLTNKALAEAVGLPAYVIERANYKRPSPANAKVIADYFEVKVTDLWPEPVRA